MNEDKIKHDFINNCIRIEIVQKLINEALDEQRPINEQYIIDLKDFYTQQVSLLENL